MEFDLAFIWAGLIAFAVLTYVALDGFDLGLGILFPFGKSVRDRDMMMNSAAPVWDGNETWLVLGGGGPFRGFSSGLRHHHAGALHANHAHAAGAGLSWRVL
ncbi:bd-type cytochrome oxidase subunit II [Yoonia sediminilitoris]|uniref:Bd-type cytochrome oxidase subunit II n=1 Tax=Yoonia sediminilitoris TaxID=1286148 RepID=A0A2T6KM99_9RHOB|nr:bd-type cytochrome oxidase subunit II [Yoonia sediminilitoris]RCW97635.1 bd-type cytochrome oxidase subunit II [Yoonia sediminilitoris]